MQIPEENYAISMLSNWFARFGFEKAQII